MQHFSHPVDCQTACDRMRAVSTATLPKREKKKPPCLKIGQAVRLVFFAKRECIRA
jgi:hypothetical protein